MYALVLSRPVPTVKAAADAQAAPAPKLTTPHEALSALVTAKLAARAVIAAVTSDEAETALIRLHDAMVAINPTNPDDIENDAEWQKVGDKLNALVEWLQQPADDATTKAELTRDDKIKLAVALARKGSSGRRGDPAEAIISTFEAGLVGICKLTYHALRLTVLGIAAVSHAAINGIIHVDAYMRGGQEVAGYDRQPAKG